MVHVLKTLNTLFFRSKAAAKVVRPLKMAKPSTLSKVRAGKWGKSMLALDAFSIAEGTWSLATHDFAELELHEIALDVLFIGLGVHGVRSHHRKYSTFGAAATNVKMKSAAALTAGATVGSSLLATAVKGATHVHQAIPSAMAAGIFDKLHSVRQIGNQWSLRFARSGGVGFVTRKFEVLKDGILLTTRKIPMDPALVKKIGAGSMIALAATLVALDVLDDDDDVSGELKTTDEKLLSFAEKIKEMIVGACDEYLQFERNPYNYVGELERSGLDADDARIEAFIYSKTIRDRVNHLANLGKSYSSLIAPHASLSETATSNKAFDNAVAQSQQVGITRARPLIQNNMSMDDLVTSNIDSLLNVQ